MRDDLSIVPLLWGIKAKRLFLAAGRWLEGWSYKQTSSHINYNAPRWRGERWSLAKFLFCFVASFSQIHSGTSDEFLSSFTVTQTRRGLLWCERMVMQNTFIGGNNECLLLCMAIKCKRLKYKDPEYGLFQFMFIPSMMNLQVQEKKATFKGQLMFTYSVPFDSLWLVEMKWCHL